MDFSCSDKNLGKVGGNNPSWACSCRIEKSHSWGQNFTKALASLIPGKKYDPSGEISLSYMDTHGGLLLSFINLKGSLIGLSKSCHLSILRFGAI